MIVKRFRQEFVESILRRLAIERSASREDFQILGYPHRSSPFLTVAEDRQGYGVPFYLIKVLTVPERDTSFGIWNQVFAFEFDRLKEEVEARIQEPAKAERTLESSAPAATRLDIPVMVGSQTGDPVKEDVLTGLLMRELIDENPGDQGADAAPLRFMVRPFVLLPSLAECAYGQARAKELWRALCEKQRIPVSNRNDMDLFLHFYREALIIEGDNRGRPEIFLTSAWRYAALSGNLWKRGHDSAARPGRW